MIAAAQALAARGLTVFPVATDCRCPLTAHGYKDASKAVEGVEALWQANPLANVAVACGAVSGVFVLDVDVKGANGLRTLAELESVHGDLPATWRTLTPSGGRHIWFRQPARMLRNRVGFAPGLDVRTDGGSVAVPPSRRAEGVYAWEVAPWDRCPAGAPDWLLNLIDPPPLVRPPRPPIRAHSRDRLASYLAAAIDGECREVSRMAPSTGRNLRLFKAAARLGELIGAGLVPEPLVNEALEASAADCGLVREDGRRAVLATIASGLARGVAQPREVRR
ncbi:MAG: bifunctional DNA primase/polymerase [Pseudomonadota bacterium]